jgi:hypothetical protein
MERLHQMTSTKKSGISKFPHVKITWWDIQQSNEAWIDEENILENDIAVCSDIGYVFKKTKDKLWLFTSYSYDDDKKLSVGGLTVFPSKTIKKIERIK